MSVRRALVDCAVLSLHDACIFYPSCKNCFSRINVQQVDTTRYRCSKCGYACLKKEVEYRYRLSLRVTRNSHIFGVTVFGSCLNRFFGTSASSLQRLVQDSEGPLATLLTQAVEDCFVGRRFVFGIKVADSDRLVSPLFNSHPPPVLGSSKDAGHFIASQIILHCAAAPGCSVVSYYRRLLQQAVDSADLSTASRPSLPPLLLQPTPPFSLDATPPSCLRSPSQHLGHALSPTPPWQQSLGMVTSSAEQEEGCSFEGDGGDLTGRQRQGTPHCVPVWQSVGAEEHTGDRVSAPSSPCGPRGSPRDGNSFWNLVPSFSDSPESPIHNLVTHTPATHTFPVPTEPGNSGNLPSSPGVRGFSDEVEENSISLLGSVAWEDMPFSESLGEFVCEAESDGVYKKAIRVMKRKGRNSVSSHRCRSNENPSNETVSRSRDNTPSAEALSDRTFLDITNTPHMSQRGLSHSEGHVCRGLGQTEGVFLSGDDVCLPGWEGGDVSIRKCTGEEDEEHLGSRIAEEEYNCSADLFNCSQSSANTQAPDTDSHPQARPGAQDPNDNEASVLDPAECSHSLDFVPFSQSTPMAKRAAPLEFRSFRASSHTRTLRTPRNTHRFTPATPSHRHTPTTSHSSTRTPKAHSRKPEQRLYILAQHHLKYQKISLKVAQKTPRRESLGVCDRSLAVCESDTEIPPTCKAWGSVPLQQRRNSGCSPCMKPLQDSATSHQQCQSGQTPRQRGSREVIMGYDGYSQRTSAGEAGPSLSVNHAPFDDSEACDWSRDLFADSF